MKKSVLKDKKILMTLITYLVVFLVGVISMVFPAFGFNNPILYASVVFYIIAFFGIFGYFGSHDEPGDYELLFFSLGSIFAASYLFISEFAKISFALGTGFLIFIVIVTLNRIYHIRKMKKSGSSLWMIKGISLILILFLSALTIQNFYRDLSDVKTVMMGYYFLTFGLLSAVELLTVTQISEKTFERILNGQFEEIRDDKQPKLKKLNENVIELDKIAKKITPKKRNKSKKISTTKK